jgi:hypothetical protein
VLTVKVAEIAVLEHGIKDDGNSKFEGGECSNLGS